MSVTSGTNTDHALKTTWLVARREIRLRVRTRAYLIISSILLIAVAVAVVLPAVLSSKSSAPDRIGVVGANTAAVSSLVAEAGRLAGGQAVAVSEPSLAVAKAALRNGDLSAVLVPGTEIFVKQVPLGGVSGPAANLAQLAGLSKLIQTVPGAATAVSHGVTLPVSGLEAQSTPLSSRLTGLATVIIVWILISAFGSQIAMGIGEEKSSRVVEVLLSTVRPAQLLIGKVLGIGLLALAQAASMVAVFVIAGFASGSDLVHGASLGVVLVGGVFIVLGYAFYCTAYAAAGSLVSRQSDVNSTILPVQLPLIVAYALSYTVLYSNGANTFYRVLGFLPPTAPVAMPVLYAAGDVPVWQVAVSAVLCAAGTVWMARIATRIYANSILKSGPRISFRQAIREARSALPANQNKPEGAAVVVDMTLIGSSDLDVFPLGLGGNTFGWTSDQETSFAVLDAYVAGGGNFIDTADLYSAWLPGHTGGESETIIGQWLTARGNRDSVVIASKVGAHPQLRGLAGANVRAAADASLARLRTDRIDLYYVHYDDPKVPAAEAAGVFSELQKAGKIRHVGLSNITAPRLREWFAAADADGFARPVALQPHYNLVERASYETELAPVAAEFGLGVLPYYGLASGFLAGKYRSATDNGGTARQSSAVRYLTPAGLAVLAALDAVAAERGVAPATVALAWLRSRPDVVAPLASARTVEQLPALLASATLTLTADETESLDKASSPVS